MARAMTGPGFRVHTLGPGLVFAGAAIGVSHLVEASRAGAYHGSGLVLVIIAACVLKYPAFAFGPWYAAATGTSLLQGYRQQGRWTLVFLALITLGTMFTVQAAVIMVTAGLAKALLGLGASIVVISGAILGICVAILAPGRYRWLDLTMKAMVLGLTALTVLATLLVLPGLDWSELRPWPRSDEWNMNTATFVAPLFGWMPATVDLAVWHSLWTLAKRRDTRHAPSPAGSLLDFNIGYAGTAVLAVCFMLLGAGVLHGAGVKLAASPGGFTSQMVALYTATLGPWSRYLIGACALAAMFSATLAVTDGFPRALAGLHARWQRNEAQGAEAEESRPVYLVSMIALSAGTLVMLDNISRLDFGLFIDIATALSFTSAPVLAILNHRAVLSAEVDEATRPGPAMRAFSLLCILLLSVFAMWWLHVRF